MHNIIEIRHKLHQIAEVSGSEKQTSDFIYRLLKQTNPDRIISNLGGYGIAAEYIGNNPNVTIMIRADIDALPISETNDLEYISNNRNVSHKCGHDGHSTILLGLAFQMREMIKELNCRVILLFQPEEETGAGANNIINDDKFADIKPDYIFGLHNLPGFPLESIIIKNGVFASASKGLSVRFHGKSSHAGHPENGKSPVLAMTGLINGLMAIPAMHTKLENAANITIVYAHLGEIAFGTAPGESTVMATFRSHRDEDMKTMTDKATKLIAGLAAMYELTYDIEWVEEFPATVNSDECNSIISQAADDLNLEIINPDIPFPWSEDFGRYTQLCKGAFFGIGAGVDSPQLHNPNYDFPDSIIQTGVDMFITILKLLGK